MTALRGYAQVCVLGPRPSAYKATSDQSATAGAIDVTRRIGEAFASVCTPRCPKVGIYNNPTARSAMVFASPPTARIVYAPSFWTAVATRYGENALLGAIAHQYGHIIDSVALGTWMNVNWSPELRADAWAG